MIKSSFKYNERVGSLFTKNASEKKIIPALKSFVYLVMNLWIAVASTPFVFLPVLFFGPNRQGTFEEHSNKRN